MSDISEKVDLDRRVADKPVDNTTTELTTCSSAEAQEVVGFYTDQEDKKLLRRLDLFLMPIMACAYGIQFADKVSLGYSSLFGLAKDTKLVGNQFSMLSTIFYVGYLLAQLPANWLLQSLPIGRVLSTMMIIWGGCVMLIAACTNYSGLMAVRFFIGVTESGISPGFLILVSQYYTRDEHASRTLFWCSMNQGFASFVGIITYLLGKHATSHPNSIAGWQAINLFLGSVTAFWGIVIFFFLGSPEKVFWLSPAQRLHTKARIVANQTNSHEVHTWSWRQARECFVDPQVYFAVLFTLVISIPNGGYTTFQNLILAGLGFDSQMTTLLGIPVSIFSVLVFFLVIWINGRWPGMRMILTAFFLIPSMVAMIVLVSYKPHTHKWTKYGVVFLIPLFALSLFLSWSTIPSNIAGRTKKSVVSALVFIAYSVGNMIGPQLFLSKAAPAYTGGLIGCIACFGLDFLVVVAWRYYYVWANAKRDRAQAALSNEQREIEGRLAGEQDWTDRENLSFRYRY